MCQIMLRIGHVALKICKNTSFLPKFSHMYQSSDSPGGASLNVKFIYLWMKFEI